MATLYDVAIFVLGTDKDSIGQRTHVSSIIKKVCLKKF
jgi:hypothetical protein